MKKLKLVLIILGLLPALELLADEAKNTELTSSELIFKDLLKSLPQSKVFVLSPVDQAWKSFTWKELKDESLKSVVDSFSKAKFSDRAGDFLLLDMTFKDEVELGSGLLLFKRGDSYICFRRKAHATSLFSLELANVVEVDIVNKKITWEDRPGLYGVILPVPCKTIFGRKPQ